MAVLYRGSERLEGRPEAKLELCPVLPRQEDLEKLKSLRWLEDGGVLRDWDEDLKLSWSSVLVLLWQEDLEKLNSPRCLEDGGWLVGWFFYTGFLSVAPGWPGVRSVEVAGVELKRSPCLCYSHASTSIQWNPSVLLGSCVVQTLSFHIYLVCSSQN